MEDMGDTEDTGDVKYTGDMHMEDKIWSTLETETCKTPEPWKILP